MPELVIAPNPSPIASTPPPSTAAAGTGSSLAEADRAASGEEAGTPFSTVLKRQIDQPSKSEKSSADTEETPRTALAKDVTEAGEVSTDVVALIAGLLAGIAQPTALAQTQKAEPATAVDTSTLPAAPEASLAIATPAIVATTQQEADSPLEQNTTQAGNPNEFRSSRPTDANPAKLAALPAQLEAGTEPGRKTGHHENFDAMLAAARDLPATTGNAAASTTPGARTEAVHPAAEIATPVGARGWESEVGAKLTWMAGSQNSKAELVLNPPHMGRIEVSLNISGDQASASFISASPAVREALENAVPRLREILQDAGISLGQAHVGAESSQQSSNRSENGDNRSGSSGAMAHGKDTGEASLSLSAAPWSRRSNSLVDTFV